MDWGSLHVSLFRRLRDDDADSYVSYVFGKSTCPWKDLYQRTYSRRRCAGVMVDRICYTVCDGPSGAILHQWVWIVGKPVYKFLINSVVIPLSTGSVSATETATTTARPSNSTSNLGLSGGAIGGIVGGTIGGVIILAVILSFVYIKSLKYRLLLQRAPNGDGTAERGRGKEEGSVEPGEISGEIRGERLGERVERLNHNNDGS